MNRCGGTKMSLDVESILREIGVEVTKDDGTEFFAKCPMHLARTGKEDRHPSWSLNGDTFAHHCFSCGYSGNLSSLYRDLTGDVPENLEWEIAKTSLIASVAREERRPEPVGPSVDEWTLSRYGDLPQPLLDRRHLLRESVDFFGIRWDNTDRCWVIPIRTPDGELLGFQFRQKGIVLNHPKGMEKSSTLFGMHLYRTESRVAVVESPLDAVRFRNIGVPAVSTFGASVSERQISLLARHFRLIVLAMDNDAAGQNAARYLRWNLRKLGCNTFDFCYDGLDAKDPGDVGSDAALRKAWTASTSLLVEGRR